MRCGPYTDAVLDETVLRVLARLEQEDAAEREAGLPAARRSRQIRPTTGRLLLALAASNPACQILELGGSRGYSTIWLAAGASVNEGWVVSVEHDPEKCAAWRRNVGEADLDSWATLVEGDAHDVLRSLRESPDLVFLDAEKEDYEGLFALVRGKLEPGGLVVADNVLSHVGMLGEYSRRRQADPTLSSVTVPLDQGLEVTVVLA
jgi:predicted O-methyltransferase YrrM